jgi:hypothetical protein
MMEESDVWETVPKPLVGSMIDSKTTDNLDLQFVGTIGGTERRLMLEKTLSSQRGSVYLWT